MNGQMMPGNKSWLCGLILSIAVTGASVAHAWGTDGHHVIAIVAASNLTTKAKAEVDRLLALEPGATLVSISTWADEHRNPATAPWHYVNFPRGNCRYDKERDCPDGSCVIAAIERQTKVLASNGPADKRLAALKYLVHFVGDIHQPLHAGFQDDRGGNSFQLQAFMRGSNLHAVWDSGLIKNLNESPASIAERVQKMADGLPLGNLDPVTAAEESCQIVSNPSFYPNRLVDVPYIERYTPVMKRRLALAGARLAGTLNRIFDCRSLDGCDGTARTTGAAM